MTKKIIRFLESVIPWLLALIPFSMCIAPAPMNVFMGLLIFCFLVKRILKKEPLFLKSPLNIPLLLFFLLTCLSLFYSINFKDTFRGGVLRLLQYVFVYFAAAQEVKNKRQLILIVFGVCAGLVLTAADEIWQVARGVDFIRGYAPIINIGLVRATASFKDANTLGIYLSALAPLVLGLALYYKKGAKKVLFMLMGLLAVCGIVLTYSRPTLLALYIALFFMAVVRKDKVMIWVLVIGILLTPFIAPASIKNWAKQVNYNPMRFMCNDDRIAVYQHSLQMIKDRPVLGRGANTFMKNFKNYNNPPHYRDVAVIDYIYAHNIYLHMAGELGLLGLGIFIWFVVVFFKSAKKIYSRLKDDFLKVVLMSLSACLLAFLVNGLTESSLYYARVAMVFWYLAGLTLAMGKINHADKP